jgi:hypothetical protein
MCYLADAPGALDFYDADMKTMWEEPEASLERG